MRILDALALFVTQAPLIYLGLALFKPEWFEWPPSAGRLRVYMTHLRRKIERDPVRPRLLTTQTGVGYRLVVEGDDAP